MTRTLITLAFALLPLLGFAALAIRGALRTPAGRFRQAVKSREKVMAEAIDAHGRLVIADEHLVEQQKALSEDLSG